MTQPFWVLRNTEWLFPHLPPTPPQDAHSGSVFQQCCPLKRPRGDYALVSTESQWFPTKECHGEGSRLGGESAAWCLCDHSPATSRTQFLTKCSFLFMCLRFETEASCWIRGRMSNTFFLCPQQRIHVFNWSLLSPREICSKQNVQTTLAQWSNRVVFLWQPWSQVMGSNSCLSNYFM